MNLLEEIKRLRELSEKANKSGDRDEALASALLAALRVPKLCDELEKAADILKFIHEELGVPQPGYPEQFAQASYVATSLLKEWGVR